MKTIFKLPQTTAKTDGLTNFRYFTVVKITNIKLNEKV